MIRIPDSFDFALPLPEPGLADRVQRSPECRLLWAVLRDGIEDYMKYARATDRRGQRLFQEVREWILLDDPTWLCSFVSICHVVGVEPVYIRDGLERWRRGRACLPTEKRRRNGRLWLPPYRGP